MIKDDFDDDCMVCLRLGRDLCRLQKSVRSLEYCHGDGVSWCCEQCAYHGLWHWESEGGPSAWACLLCQIAKHFVHTPHFKQDCAGIWEVIETAKAGGGVSNLGTALDSYLHIRDTCLVVGDIRATHDKISPYFRHGHRGRPLSELVDALRDGTASVVMEGSIFQGSFRSICNRRTFCVWDAF